MNNETKHELTVAGFYFAEELLLTLIQKLRAKKPFTIPFALPPTLLAFLSHKTTVIEYLDVTVLLERLNLTALLEYLNLTN